MADGGKFCGDGVVDGMEECDGANLGGESCADFGLAGGQLSCDGQCRFDKSGCGGCGDNSPVVAMGWAGLTSGGLEHGIDIAETWAKVDATVWTNTTVAGELASDLHCVGWTSKVVDANNTTTVGVTAKADAHWTVGVSGQLCPGTRRLYCFQDPR